jgi:hypothetical protein
VPMGGCPGGCPGICEEFGCFGSESAVEQFRSADWGKNNGGARTNLNTSRSCATSSLGWRNDSPLSLALSRQGRGNKVQSGQAHVLALK